MQKEKVAKVVKVKRGSGLSQVVLLTSVRKENVYSTERCKCQRVELLGVVFRIICRLVDRMYTRKQVGNERRKGRCFKLWRF